jgi:hypothetical protein
VSRNRKGDKPITFPSLFIKRLSSIDSKVGIIQEIERYILNQKLNMTIQEAIYHFVNTTLRDNTFSTFEDITIKELLYEAAYYASTETTKRPHQAFNALTVDSSRDNLITNLIFNLTQHLITFYLLDNKKFIFNIKYAEFLNIITNMGCKERNRRRKKLNDI